MDNLIEFFTGSTAVKRKSPAKKRSAVKRKSPAKKRSTVKRKSPAKKRSAVKRKSPAKKRSAVKRKSPAKKRSAVKRKSPAKKRSQRGGVNNRKSNDWEIHSNWLKDRKRMKPVAVFKMDKKIKVNEGKCAKQIEENNNLERSSETKRSPVWIQRVNTEDGSKYYIVFIAIEHGEGVEKFMMTKKKMFDNTCFENSTDISLKFGFKIRDLVQDTNTKKEYTTELEKIINIYDKFSNELK